MIRTSFSLLSCRKMKINLRQTKNHSAEIDFSFGAQNPAHFRRETKKAVVPEYYKYF